MPDNMYCPCKGCENRFIGCHSKCPLYADFREETNYYNKQRDLQKIIPLPTRRQLKKKKEL